MSFLLLAYEVDLNVPQAFKSPMLKLRDHAGIPIGERNQLSFEGVMSSLFPVQNLHGEGQGPGILRSPPLRPPALQHGLTLLPWLSLL